EITKWLKRQPIISLLENRLMIRRSGIVKITTLRRRTIKKAENLLRAHCPICLREVAIHTRSRAVGILEVDDLEFDQLIADGRVHLIRTVSGNHWICGDSLFSR